jgi:epoxyqueuosine reductase
MPDPFQSAAIIKAKAIDLGFDLVGIAPAQESQYRDYFRQWLDDGRAGTMEYLSARFDERTDPRAYMPGAASVICVAMNYFVPLEEVRPPPLSSPGVPGEGIGARLENNRGRIARYALGMDYHELIKDRLHQLADFVREIDPAAQTRCAVDTAPIMEKELSARAGVGWMGKNTCIISPDIGSWLLLGEVMTTLPLPADEPAVDRCGACRRCIDACPTGAITEPYQLDARRCISYLTIEHRDALPADMQDQLNGWVFGCDICQEVCPWNRKPPHADDPALAPRFAGGSINLNDLLRWTPGDYRVRLKGSAMKRVKLPVLQRNAAAVKKTAR